MITAAFAGIEEGQIEEIVIPKGDAKETELFSKVKLSGDEDVATLPIFEDAEGNLHKDSLAIAKLIC
jgi:hypothetical protein